MSDFGVPMSTKGCVSFSSFDTSSAFGTTPSQSTGSMETLMQPTPAAQPNQPVTSYTQSTPAPAPVQTKQRPAATGVILKKGQKVNLAQGGEVLNNLRIALGWDLVNVACDLDTSAFMLSDNGKVIGDDWFVFYGQLNSPDGAVIHRGDSDGTTSAGGDDEAIDIDLNRLNPAVKRIVFVVTINEAFEKGQNFSMVANAYVRALNQQTGKELVRFQLTDYYSNVCSMAVGELYKHNGQWKFNAIGNGLAQDLAGLCATYGVNVQG